MNRHEKDALFTRLIRQNKSRIYMMCQAYCDDNDAVDDCFQEVAIKIWNGLDTFKNQSTIETWIYRVILNACITYRRNNKRIPNTESILIDVADSNDTEREDHIEKLYSLIRQLNRYDRALVLLWLENLSYAEIADIMGLSVNNVSVKLVRIKEKLKSLSKNI